MCKTYLTQQPGLSTQGWNQKDQNQPSQQQLLPVAANILTALGMNQDLLHPIAKVPPKKEADS